MDYLTTHTILSPIRRGFAPGLGAKQYYTINATMTPGLDVKQCYTINATTTPGLGVKQYYTINATMTPGLGVKQYLVNVLKKVHVFQFYM